MLTRKNTIVIISMIGICIGVEGQFRFELNETPTYKAIIDAYMTLDQRFEAARLIEIGSTDAGKPLHVFLISSDANFKVNSIYNQRVLLINNGIHPGEPCGIDASIKLATDLLEDNNGLKRYLQDVTVAIIPVYNVGGSLNRGCCTRANQNGPLEKGFRGNAKNLDLNRDFIKCDSKNAKALTGFIAKLNPDIFIDTHTSNGADYQYVMTLIATQQNKLHPTLASFMNDKMLPNLYSSMKESGYEMSPYVYSMHQTPDSGIKAFLETPRYSTGFTTLHNILGFTTETHMFKPYRDRVLSTYEFLVNTLKFTSQNSSEIKAVRSLANDGVKTQKEFTIRWELDSAIVDTILFKGYEATQRISEVTGENVLYYNQQLPYEKSIRFLNSYQSSISVTKPDYYIIPQAWENVVDNLKLNDIEFGRLAEDTLLFVEVYYIEKAGNKSVPYEGHYPHFGVAIRKEKEHIQYYSGDYVVQTNQIKNRFIVETLEPQAHDSYFTWNFFDEILQQKEWFSSYVFDTTAARILKEDSILKGEFEKKKSGGELKTTYDQYRYIYQNSEFYEKEHNRYPVTRYNGKLF